MIIHELHIKGFGKWRNRTFTFAPGINLFAAPNESGKSTLLHAILASLYGLKRDYVRQTRYLDEYDKYLPWDQGPYETIVQYQLAGQMFRLHRQLSKEREQAKLYLDPELIEITRQYKEDKRKEFNFLERHLNLNRSLFTDVTWVKREPLQAPEYLLPSLSRPDAADPLVNQILAGIEQEIAQIGKKENAENTLLGKAAKRLMRDQQAVDAAEQAWQTTSHLTQSIADWQIKLSGLQRQQKQLITHLQEVERAEEVWQERWQLTFHMSEASQFEEWELQAETPEEEELHRSVKERLEALAQQQKQATQLPQWSSFKSQLDRERLQTSYEKGWELVKAVEEKKQALYEIASTLSGQHQLPSRGERSGSTQTGKGNAKAVAAFAVTGLFGFLALFGLFADQKVFAAVTGCIGLTALLLGLYLRLQFRGNNAGTMTQPPGQASEQQHPLEAQEIDRLLAKQRQNKSELRQLESELQSLLQEWEAGNWEEFLIKREQTLTILQRDQTNRLANEMQEQQDKDELLKGWAEKVRERLHAQKADLANRRAALKEEVRHQEELMVELRERIAKGNGEVGRSDQHSWAKAKSEYDEAAAAMEELLMKRESLNLARETLHSALKDWQREMSPDVNRIASEIMEQITGGDYRDVRLDPSEKFAVRAIDPRQQKVVELEQFSSGTQDQLYFAQRIALLQHVSSRTEPLPLFLDDHFIHYDEVRLAKALDYLVQLAEERQLFLFSCQERERKILQPRLQGSTRHTVLDLENN